MSGSRDEAYRSLFRKTEKTEEVAPGGSLAVLLTQGLMANDAPKVDTVLKDSNLETIRVCSV